ncbi:substrate-binding domain-containing protein, partial [Paraburkholderia sp. A1RI_3L]|uniref:substrate-binding domain-containing protein n=1 Tax=Paraburkholderia TaxID=1822464 RepID=UPI002408718B|nr:substrate-binding domain-containing protein [Paraburkholderia sp. SUR17]WEY41293.1 substrate-binding domain-containing protein [Paraburkholderia sp. SUR17]
MKSSKRKICQVLALVLSSVGATAAMAAGPLVQGGGSSLVAPTIGSVSQANTEIGLFGTSEATFTYYSVGSGAGQNGFLSNAPSFFGSTVTGTVDFANSDAALSTAQVTNYKSSTVGTASGPLIQIPYIVTPIAIPLINAPAVTSTTTPQTTPSQAHSIALNDDDLCGIFSGKLTNWNQVTNPETSATYSLNSPIKVVYRADGSGTTELLTRHLAAVCTTANTASGVTFVDSLTFANTSAFPSGVPSNFVSATGSGGVRSALLTIQSSSGSPAAVAYISPDYTNTFLAPSSSSASPALQVASLFNARNSTYYAPTAANATTALGSIAAPTGTAAADPTQWVPVSGANYTALANPASGYPVSGTSQIILSQCYADANVTKAVTDYLNDHYTNATFASVVHGNGFDTVPSGFQSAIVGDFLTANRNNLNIGNSTVCSGKGR